MRRVLLCITFFASTLAPTIASAYKLGGEGCDGNGKECKVYCNNGNLAGSMYWNGQFWTDGQKWDADKDKEAKKICAANGSDCQ